MVVEAQLDREGLRTAFDELLEEGFAQERLGNVLEFSSDEGRERIFGAMPRRKLSPGYYEAALYIFWLESMGHAGGDRALDAAELASLDLLRQARNGFQRNHPACGDCGAHQDGRFATACHHCGAKFRRSAE